MINAKNDSPDYGGVILHRSRGFLFYARFSLFIIMNRIFPLSYILPQ